MPSMGGRGLAPWSWCRFLIAVAVILVPVIVQGESATSRQSGQNLISATQSVVHMSGDGANPQPELVGAKPMPGIVNELIDDDLSKVETRDALVLALSFSPRSSATKQATTIHRCEVVEDRSDPVIQARRPLHVTPMVGR